MAYLTNQQKLESPRQWRIVKQRRKLGGTFYLQDGRFVYNGLSGNVSWYTFQEWDYKTREAAIDGLKSMPLTWGGDRSKVLGRGALNGRSNGTA